MNHEYQPHPEIDNKCIDCGYPREKHGSEAPCDSCENIASLEFFSLSNAQALLCRDCIEKEKQLNYNNINSPQERKRVDDYQSPERQADRLDTYNRVVRPYEALIADARRIDEQIHLSTDIFNARTVAFVDLRDAIMQDDSISSDNKIFELASVVKRRIKHFQEVIFDLDKQKIEAYSEQKALHVQLNALANQLRTDERERLKLSDITYDVKTPKSVSPQKIRTNPKAASKEELRKVAAELNIKEFTIQMVMTSKNWTLEQAANHLRRSINEGKSMSAPPAKSNDTPPNEDDGMAGVRKE